MRDIQLAIRSARRRPFLTGIIVTTLALGLSLTTVVFSIADRVLFRELPYADASRLVVVQTILTNSDGRSGLAAATLTRIAAEAPSLAAIGAMRGASLTVTGPDGPIAIQGAAVTTNMFGVLGIRPLVGPGFTQTALTDPARPEVLLSHALWQTTFGGDPGILRRSVVIGSVPHTVVGVLPPNTVFPIGTAEAWTPLDLTPFLADPERSRRQRFFFAIGRLGAGATAERAASELGVVGSRLAAELPLYHANERFGIVSLRGIVVGDAADRVTLLLIAGVLLLAISCANAASVLWAQVISRRGEFAVRSALGAARSQLARQLTVEGLVLGIAGGALGIAAAPALAAVLRPMTAPFLPAVGLPGIDLRILGIATIACIASGVVLGFFPALLVGRGSLVTALRSAGRSGGHGKSDSRVRAALLVVQTSLCVALLVTAGLLMKSLVQLQRLDLGFNDSQLLVFELTASRARYPNEDAVRAFYENLESELGAIPGVTAVTSGSALPLVGGTWASVGIDGRPVPPGQLPQSAYASVGENYFELFGIPLRQGRLVDPRSTNPEFVINETMAKQFWPNGNAIGARIRIGPVQTGPWATVVGIVADMKDRGATFDLRAMAFGSNQHYPFSSRAIVVRANGDPTAHAPAVRRVVSRLDPTLAIVRMRTYGDVRSADVERERMSALLLAIFASGALTLALVGIYGLTAAVVAGRSREIGIRIALGAQQHRVLADAMSRGLRLTLLGLVIGLATSAAVTRVFASLMHGVDPFDPTVYLGVTLLLGLVAAVATWIPSRRATRIDPVVALRSD